MRHTRTLLIVILLIALALRLFFALALDPLAPYDRAAGGDAWWYLEFSYRQVVDVGAEPLSTAPLYLLLLGGLRWLLQPETVETVVLAAPPGGGLDVISVPGAPSTATVIVVRVVQAVLNTATVYFVYRITRAISRDERAGLIAAAVMALSVAMLVSTAEIQTETVYLFFLTAAMMLYVELSSGEHDYHHPLLWLAVSGGLFGLATLTRAVLLLFPVGLLIHALLVRWRGGRTQVTVRGVTVLLAVYVAVNAIWTGYYYARWGQVVVGAKGMSAFLYLGAQGDWQGPEDTDAALGATADDPVEDADFVEGASEIIAANPAGYLVNRVRDLARAYAQPYGTVAFPGESVRALAADWLRDDRSLGGLVALFRVEGFVPKLLIYLTHYGGIVLGLVGMWLLRGRWRASLPLMGFLLYVTLLHLLLLALPRYLFPTLPFWWCFAAVAIERLCCYARSHPLTDTGATIGKSTAV